MEWEDVKRAEEVLAAAEAQLSAATTSQEKHEAEKAVEVAKEKLAAEVAEAEAAQAAAEQERAEATAAAAEAEREIAEANTAIAKHEADAKVRRDYPRLVVSACRCLGRGVAHLRRRRRRL